MDKYILENNDYKILGNLIKITNSIEVLYKKLCQLDIEGLKNTDEYRKIIDYLNVSIEAENSCYIKLNLNYKKSIALIEYLLNDRISLGFSNDFNSIMNQNNKNNTFRRILNVLSDNYITTFDIENGRFTDTDKKSLKLLDKDIFEYSYDISYFNGLKMDSAFKHDILTSFLYYLNQSILKDENQNNKTQLLTTKYNVIFSNKSIEKDYILNSFESNKEIYVSSNVIAELLELDDYTYNKIKSIYGRDLTIRALRGINKSKNESRRETCYALLMSSIIFLNKSGKEIVKNNLKRVIRDKDDYNKLIELFDNAIQKNEIEKKKIKRINVSKIY